MKAHSRSRRLASFVPRPRTSHESADINQNIMCSVGLEYIFCETINDREIKEYVDMFISLQEVR